MRGSNNLNLYPNTKLQIFIPSLRALERVSLLTFYDPQCTSVGLLLPVLWLLHPCTGSQLDQPTIVRNWRGRSAQRMQGTGLGLKLKDGKKKSPSLGLWALNCKHFQFHHHLHRKANPLSAAGSLRFPPFQNHLQNFGMCWEAVDI